MWTLYPRRMATVILSREKPGRTTWTTTWVGSSRSTVSFAPGGSGLGSKTAHRPSSATSLARKGVNSHSTTSPSATRYTSASSLGQLPPLATLLASLSLTQGLLLLVELVVVAVLPVPLLAGLPPIEEPVDAEVGRAEEGYAKGEAANGEAVGYEGERGSGRGAEPKEWERVKRRVRGK